MKATVLIVVILAFIGCANLTPEQKEAQREAREYRVQEYYLTKYLPAKRACQDFWVEYSYGTSGRISSRKRPSMQQMRGARCLGSLSELSR